MSLFMNQLRDQRFLKEMNDFTEIIELLLKYKQTEAAYSYELCFYACLLGFIHKNFTDDLSVIKLFFESLSIDTNLLNDLKRHLENQDIEEKNSSSIYFSYRKAAIFKCEDPKKMLTELLNLHLRIARAIYTRKEIENKNIFKKLLLNINLIQKNTNDY